MTVSRPIILIGSGIIGQGIASRLLRARVPFYVFIRNAQKSADFMRDLIDIEGLCNCFSSYKTLFDAIGTGCGGVSVFLMVPHKNVASVLADLSEFLTEQDRVFDCGNSRYSDIQKRSSIVKACLIDVGISGGRLIKDRGACVMVGCDDHTLHEIEKTFFSSIAYLENGEIGLIYLPGPIGTAHFVKAVHNFIEYGFMQAVAELLSWTKHGDRLDTELIRLLESVNNESTVKNTLLISLLLEALYDPIAHPVWNIVPECVHNGTASWIASFALEHGIMCDSGFSAISFRVASLVSSNAILEILDTPKASDETEISAATMAELLNVAFCFTLSQAQLIVEKYAELYGTPIGFQQLLHVWKYGSVISSYVLDVFREYLFLNTKSIEYVLELYLRSARDLDRILSNALLSRIPMMFFMSMQSFFAIMTRCNGANCISQIIQIQRHMFGGHKYEISN